MAYQKRFKVSQRIGGSSSVSGEHSGDSGRRAHLRRVSAVQGSVELMGVPGLLCARLFWAVLGLQCCAQAFSSCKSRAYSGCGAWASLCHGFACCRVQALGVQASVLAAHGLSSCGTWAYMPHYMWDLPRPRIESMSPALAGGLKTSGPPGKSYVLSKE